jgi:hypothetical protein
VNGGTKFPIYGRVIGADVETVEGAVTLISVKIGIGMVAPMAVDTLNLLTKKSLVKMVLVKMIMKRQNWREL